MSKSLTALAALGAAALAGQDLSTDYARKKPLRVEIDYEQSIESTTEASLDGEPAPGRGGGGGASSKSSRKAVIVDQVVELKEGAPLVVRRTFETLEGAGEVSFGETTREFELDAKLSGVTLEISAAGGEVEVKVVEGATPEDKSLLEGHKPGLALDAFLPVGDAKEWDLDQDAVLRGLSLDVAPALFQQPAPPEEASGEGRGGGRRGGPGRRMGGGPELMRTASWEGRAKLGEDAEHDGEPCAVIELELEARGELPEPQLGGGRPRDQAFGPEAFAAAVRSNSFEVKLEGRLLFSRSRRLPLLLELEGEFESESSGERQTERGTFSWRSTQEGDLKYRVSLAEQAE